MSSASMPDPNRPPLSMTLENSSAFLAAAQALLELQQRAGAGAGPSWRGPGYGRGPGYRRGLAASA